MTQTLAKNVLSSVIKYFPSSLNVRLRNTPLSAVTMTLAFLITISMQRILLPLARNNENLPLPSVK